MRQALGAPWRCSAAVVGTAKAPVRRAACKRFNAVDPALIERVEIDAAAGGERQAREERRHCGRDRRRTASRLTTAPSSTILPGLALRPALVGRATRRRRARCSVDQQHGIRNCPVDQLDQAGRLGARRAGSAAATAISRYSRTSSRVRGHADGRRASGPRPSAAPRCRPGSAACRPASARRARRAASSARADPRGRPAAAPSAAMTADASGHAGALPRAGRRGTPRPRNRSMPGELALHGVRAAGREEAGDRALLLLADDRGDGARRAASG